MNREVSEDLHIHYENDTKDHWLLLCKMDNVRKKIVHFYMITATGNGDSKVRKVSSKLYESFKLCFTQIFHKIFYVESFFSHEYYAI